MLLAVGSLATKQIVSIFFKNRLKPCFNSASQKYKNSLRKDKIKILPNLRYEFLVVDFSPKIYQKSIFIILGEAQKNFLNFYDLLKNQL